MPIYDLGRFKDAQRDDVASAVAELRAGRKQSHWIWYVFPQLRGLGTSPVAVHYGLDGEGEAHAYLRDPVLRAQYLEALTAVHQQLVDRGARLDTLMGSHIDALKLVSSVTLFEHAARTAQEPDAAAGAREPAVGAEGETDSAACGQDVAAIASLAADVLAVAARQGFPRCAWTLRAIS